VIISYASVEACMSYPNDRSDLLDVIPDEQEADRVLLRGGEHLLRQAVESQPLQVETGRRNQKL